MIIKAYNSIFIHIPKTAGQTVEDYILHCLGKDRKTGGDEFLLKLNANYPKGPKRLAHLSASEYTDLGFVSPEQFEAYFKFAIVRNPWQRLLSLYKFRGFAAVTSFSTFIQYYLPYYMEHEHWFFRPQTDFVYDVSDNLLVDFLGRMERLEDDFDQIAGRLGLAAKELPHTNAAEVKFFSAKTLRLWLRHPHLLTQLSLWTDKDSYREHYSPKDMLLVHQHYQRDIELLEYKF